MLHFVSDATAALATAIGSRGVLVAGTRPPDVLELWDWTLGPGESHASEAHSTGTQEVLQVQRGQVTITVGERGVELAAGDAVAFDGDVEHAYSNPGSTPARFSLAVFEPDVGSSVRPARREGRP